jgi:peptide chain release factor 2
MNTQDIQNRINEIEENMSKQDFWSDKDLAQQQLSELAQLRDELLGDKKHDQGNAVITIFAGAGGDDAEDFVRILFEMYQSFSDQYNYDLSILATTPNTMNGYRNISFEIQGKGAYGLLRAEQGVHRLVRKSPFNSKGKRQTSFVLVEVLPYIKAQDFILPESELEISFARSGGAGGQNVNKRETAVRIVHPKTGFSVFISEERTQERNRDRAMEIMRAKLYQKHLVDEKQRQKGLSISDKVTIEWGNQMRSYIYDPYQLVKNHVSGKESRDIQAVLSGSIQLVQDDLA